MRKRWLKYGLTIVWLFCFFAFKKAYWAEPSTQVAIHLGIMKYDDHSKVDGRWQSCMSYLSKEGICSTIEVSDRSLRGNTAFATWLQELTRHGHQIIYKQKAKNRCHTEDEPAFSPLQIRLAPSQSELSPSLPTINFRRHFSDLVKSTDFFIIKDNPSSWNDKQLGYFKENIGYLLHQGINFVPFEKDRSATRGRWHLR